MAVVNDEPEPFVSCYLRLGSGDHSSAGRSPPLGLPGTGVRIAEAACQRFAGGVQLRAVNWKLPDRTGPGLV